MDSSLLEYKRSNDLVRKFEEALTELKNNAVLMAFNREEDVQGNQNKILDVKYSLSPHLEFVKEELPER